VKRSNIAETDQMARLRGEQRSGRALIARRSTFGGSGISKI
jgi:hypothetical protein